MDIVRGQGYAIFNCDVLEGLSHIPDESVQCVVTSPPYYGLRNYGTNPQIWGGDPECEHAWGSELPCHHPGQVEQTKWKTAEAAGSGQFCSRCGAWKGELGLEPTPQMYVEHLTQIFHEIRRVLRSDGTLWLNIGDSYYGGKGSNGSSKARRTAKERGYTQPAGTVQMDTRPLDLPQEGLKPKDLVGIPWMLAFALRDDGWWLRQDIIWNKPNPMPESITDRCTKAHEYVFLFSKSSKYYFDSEAVKEPSVTSPEMQVAKRNKHPYKGQIDPGGGRDTTGGFDKITKTYAKRNRRSVWQIATKPFRGAHFAVMPEALVEPCILAGTSEAGCCIECGTPYRRELKKGEVVCTGGSASGARASNMEAVSPLGQDPNVSAYNTGEFKQYTWETIGWKPQCSCGTEETKPCIVLDPFSGSGTVGVVALQHGQRYIGIELNPEYVEISRKRIEDSLEKEPVVEDEEQD